MALEKYKLFDVQKTGKVLGRGARGTVEELVYRGLLCAGKKLHSVLAEEEGSRRLWLKECSIHSQLLHPNIVQFLGVYYQPSISRSELPVLVIEFLPATLAKCLGFNGRLPEETNYSILRDVALGLNYLHQRPAPVIHCDLTVNHVMLTSSLRAKIANFEVSEILEPGRYNDTNCPGTPGYMPPEALGVHPQYNTKLDMFSFGVLMIHTLCAQFPFPTVVFREDPSKPCVLIVVSESDRRAKWLDRIGRDHPLMDLILQCLSDDPHRRPTAVEALIKISQRAEAAGYSLSPSTIHGLRDIQQSREECARLEQELRQQREQSLRDNQQSREECSRLQQELQQQREQSIRGSQQSREEHARLEQELQQQREQSMRDNQQSREECARLERELQQQREQSMREREGHQQQVGALQLRLDAALAEVQQLRRTPQVTSRHQQSWNIPRQDVQVLSEIGTGAWGTVAKGKFRGQSVAVKWPHPAILNEHTVERLRREVQIMAQVKHPNLLLFVGAVFDGRLPPLIVTELLDMNLRMAYERGRLTGFSKVPIFQDVAYALHYLHEHQEPIIHRDVSTPNVLLQELPSGMFRAKVSDFGSANLARLAQTAGEGAIIYAAPETLPQTRDIHSPPPPQTAKMDVYSYGILLGEVITSQFPDPDKLWSMLQQVQRQWPFMYELIIACTKRSPDERPTMAEVLDNLNKLPRPRPGHQT